MTSALRVVGLGDEQHFQNYHRVLNRAAWKCRQASLTLLRLLLDTFTPPGPLVLGLDDTIERRWGSKIQGQGIYRALSRRAGVMLVKCQPTHIAVIDFRKRSSPNAYGCILTSP